MVYINLSIDEVETPYTIEGLQPKLMVMSGPCCPEVGFTSVQESVETPKAPHHSFVCIECQSHT